MNTALANLTWKGKWFHSKGMSISNVCFDHFFVWFWCPLKVKRKLNIINCCLVTYYIMVYTFPMVYGENSTYFKIGGVRVRGHKSFYAHDLEEIIKKFRAKSGATKACQNQCCKGKNVSFLVLLH